jgi:type I restriction enzyme S subunit
LERTADGAVRDITDELPFEIPESWEWVRLGSLINKLTDGTHRTPKYAESGVSFLSVKDMSDGRLNFNNTKFITHEEHAELYKRCNPEFGDVLLTKVGTTGIPVLVDTDKEFSLFVSVALLKFSQELLYGKYFIGLLQSPLVAVQCAENTRGVGNKNWVIRDIANTLVVLPPFDEQKRIVVRLNEVQPYLEKYDVAKQRLTTLNAAFPEALKKSILQAAVQGKLVPQDPADEPADALLERIRTEKEALIKAGKIKRNKHESVIFRRDNTHYEKQDGIERCIDDEIPFDVPENWAWVRLGTLCDYGECENVESCDIAPEAWLLDLEDIEKDSGRLLQRKRKHEVKSLSTKHRFTMGQVLYSKLRPYLNKVIIADEDGYCTSEILPLDFGMAVYDCYAQIYLMSPLFVAYATQCSYGVKMPRLGTQDGRSALVPLPPFAEQKRIISRVDALLLVRDRLI